MDTAVTGREVGQEFLGRGRVQIRARLLAPGGRRVPLAEERPAGKP